MRYEITAQQMTHFKEAEEIGFEDLLSDIESAHIASLPAGEELWRDDPILKKTITRRWVSEIFKTLTGVHPLQLLFDFSTTGPASFYISELPIQGFLGGLFFTKGESLVTFFTSRTPLHLEYPSYIVLYGETNSLYVEKKNTPFSYSLKKKGYTYGDRLKVEDFPLVR